MGCQISVAGMNDNEKRIIFRHTPKSAGTYIWRCLQSIGNYMSLGEVSTYKQLCPEAVCDHFGITYGGQETGVVESNCDETIPRVMRAHYSLNHLNKHSDDNIVVISNIRHPVPTFYSEFYHHRGGSAGLVWAKWLGNDIDNYMDGNAIAKGTRPSNLEQWAQHYVDILTNLIDEVHIIISQDNIPHGLEQLNNMGFNIKPIAHHINTCPEKFTKKYNYRLDDVTRALKPAIELYQQSKEKYFNH